MGLFSGKKKIKVSSTVLNLAGDIGSRPNFLKTLIFDQTMHRPFDSFGDALQHNYLNGPGLNLRKWPKWCRTNEYYESIGMSKGYIKASSNIDLNNVITVLTYKFGSGVVVKKAEIGFGNVYHWADSWLMDNYPDLIDLEYDATFIEGTNDVVIIFEDTGDVYNFTAEDFVSDSEYLYVLYHISGGEEEGELFVGDVEEVDELPDVSNLLRTSNDDWGVVYRYTKESVLVRTYDDGRPDETEVMETDGSFTRTKEVSKYVKETQIPISVDNPTVLVEKEFHEHTSFHRLVPIVTTTTEDFGEYVLVITTTDYTIEEVFEVKVDTQTNKLFNIGPGKYYIYRYGSGEPLLDGEFNNDTESGTYFPFIPIRNNKRFLSDEYLPDIYEDSVKALGKALGSKKSYDKVIDTLSENEDIGDVNFGYIVFGVSLNTIEDAGKHYIFNFFKYAENKSGSGESVNQEYDAQWEAADQSMTDWKLWLEAQEDVNDPLFGTPDIGTTPYPARPQSTFTLRSNKGLNLLLTISWHAIEITSGTGRGHPDILNNQVVIVKEDVLVNPEQVWLGEDTFDIRFSQSEKISIIKQTTENEWEKVSVYGLTSNNIIYKGKGVFISSHAALDDTEESGFLVPLNEEIFREMGLVKSTQLSTSCAYLVLNSYIVVKQKWYQTGAFKVLLVIAVIAIAVFTGGAGAAAGGVLGTNVAVGAAVGLTGVAAVVVGAIANAIAAVIITRIITAAASKLLGDKLGSIVGAIASMVAINVASNFSSGSTMNFVDAFKADNLIKFSTKLATEMGTMYQQEAEKIMRDTGRLMSEYEKELSKITSAYNEQFGNYALIDPLKFTEIPTQIYIEQPNIFLDRTLMTGTDVADISMNAINSFTDIMLQLNLEI